MVEEAVYELEARLATQGGAWRAKITPQLVSDIKLLADLLAIKVNDTRPWYETGQVKATDTTEEVLYSRAVRPGQIVVLTHVSMKNASHTGTTMQIAIARGGETLLLNRDVPSAANISVDWDGQVLLSEGDKVKVSHFGATSADLINFSASGYEIKA